jgi:hypothetical protein
VQKWEDGVRMGVGLEYSLSLLKLRGAYYSEPQAAVSSTMNPAIPDAGRRNVFLIGFQVPIGPLKFHASYEKMFIGDADVQNWNLIPDGTGYDNLAGKYNMDVDNMMFGVDYPF